MDYQYAFRQAHKDRLEDAGVVKYRPADGVGVFGRKHQNHHYAAPSRLQAVIAALVNLVAK